MAEKLPPTFEEFISTLKGHPLPPDHSESSWRMPDHIDLPTYEEYVANGGEPQEGE